jgi:hypothetical protein
MSGCEDVIVLLRRGRIRRFNVTPSRIVDAQRHIKAHNGSVSASLTKTSILDSFTYTETREEVEVRHDESGILYPELIRYIRAQGDVGSALAASGTEANSTARIIECEQQPDPSFSPRRFLDETYSIPDTLKRQWQRSETVLAVQGREPFGEVWQPALEKYRRLRSKRLGRFEGSRACFLQPIWEKLKANSMLDREPLSSDEIRLKHPEWLEICGLAMINALQSKDFAFFKELEDHMAVAMHVRKGKGKRKNAVSATDEETAIAVAIKLRMKSAANPTEDSLIEAIRKAGVDKGSKHWKMFLRKRCGLGFLLGADKRKFRKKRIKAIDFTDIAPKWLKQAGKGSVSDEW